MVDRLLSDAPRMTPLSLQRAFRGLRNQIQNNFMIEWWIEEGIRSNSKTDQITYLGYIQRILKSQTSSWADDSD